MTNLDCSVVNCLHNRDNTCCLDSIHVDGSGAKVTEETCCKSFTKKGANASMNCASEPKKPTDVACDAVDCIYNEECRCDAEHIGIAGRDACSCTQTECASFRSK